MSIFTVISIFFLSNDFSHSVFFHRRLPLTPSPHISVVDFNGMAGTVVVVALVTVQMQPDDSFSIDSGSLMQCSECLDWKCTRERFIRAKHTRRSCTCSRAIQLSSVVVAIAVFVLVIAPIAARSFSHWRFSIYATGAAVINPIYANGLLLYGKCQFLFFSTSLRWSVLVVALISAYLCSMRPMLLASVVCLHIFVVAVIFIGNFGVWLFGCLSKCLFRYRWMMLIN